MSLWAQPGVQCVCVNASWKRGRSLSLFAWLRLLWAGLPVVGGRYTITNVGKSDRGIVVRLRGWGDVWFHVDNFRPLTAPSQEQDVALFAHHLRTAPLRVNWRKRARWWA